MVNLLFNKGLGENEKYLLFLFKNQRNILAYPIAMRIELCFVESDINEIHKMWSSLLSS